ncbi:MAG: CheR family methyltransferase [Planctomycetota bacterium]
MALLESIDELTEEQVKNIAQMVKESTGINLHEGKTALIRARLAKRLRQLGLNSYRSYMQYLRADRSGDEFTYMLDSLSTNVTGFFREDAHFDYLARYYLSRAIERPRNGKRRMRIWSAGCSSGEEPYSIAIVLHETIPNLTTWDARILATDLSTRILSSARHGVYSRERVDSIPPFLRGKYFRCIQQRPEKRYKVAGSLRGLVHFARLNLMGPWPMKGPFDVIFCRNVMIYFDKATQTRLINRYYDYLVPGGVLFMGHSESLAGIKHRFSFVQPAVYEKG